MGRRSHAIVARLLMSPLGRSKLDISFRAGVAISYSRSSQSTGNSPLWLIPHHRNPRTVKRTTLTKANEPADERRRRAEKAPFCAEVPARGVYRVRTGAKFGRVKTLANAEKGHPH